MILSVHLVMPGAAVPMIVTREAKQAGAFDIERHVERIRFLVEKMAGIRRFVAPGSIVGAPHISPGADALIRPALPLSIGIQPDGNDRRFGSVERPRAKHQAEARRTKDSSPAPLPLFTRPRKFHSGHW